MDSSQFEQLKSRTLGMQYVISRNHSRHYICKVIPFIQAQMMYPIDQFLWSLYHYLIERIKSHSLIVCVGCCNYYRKRRTSPVSQQATLRTAFCSINGAWPGSAASQRGFRYSTLKRLPLPFDAEFLVIVVKQNLPSLLKDASFDPLAVNAVDGRSRRKLVTRKSLPLAAGPDYASRDGLFYQVRQALAAVGKGLKIRFSDFNLSLRYFCSSTYFQ
jgi:hypothetical protein